MAAGDFHVRRNSGDTSSVPNAGGGNEDAHWDNLVRENGSIVTYSDPNFQLDIGIYLIMYSERFNTTDVTNNQRIEIQGEIHQSGVGVIGGYGQDYIRKSSGQQDCVVSGQVIVEVTSNNTDFFIRFYRTDNSTTGTVTRVPDYGGLIILELDDTDNYGLYSRSTTVSSSGTSWVDFTANNNDRQDTGFSNNGSGVITVTNAGRYLVSYSLDIDQNGTGREEAQGRITINGTTTVEVGSYSACYMRGSNGCQDGALSWIGIIDVAASDTLRVQFGAPLTSVAIDCTSGYFQLWQIPSGADEIIVNATNGNHNATGDFAWDTVPHIDTGSFTHTAGSTNIDIDQEDYILAFATTAQLAADSPQRPYPIRQFAVNDILQNNMSCGYYHRNSGAAGALTTNIMNLMYVGANQSVEMNTLETAVTGTCTNDSGQFSILSLESVFGPYSFPPSISDVDTDNAIIYGQTDIVITGSNFGATQGTGKVELWDDQSGTTKTIQTIDSWSDTSIQFDSVQGSLPDNTTIYLVVTINGGTESVPFAITVGLPSYEDLLTPLTDHYWILNNTYNDTGDTGPVRNMTSGIIGTWNFTSTPIRDGNTHALLYESVTNRREIADSPNMNITIDSAERTLGFWLQLNEIQHDLGSIFKEGGGVQNLAFLVGYGNELLFQGADTPGNAINAQCWSSFKLKTGRPYHICGRYSLSEGTRELRLYIDGEEQPDSDGNPLGAGSFNSHSGDCTWCDPDNNLETGGTDIAYAGINDCVISDFFTCSDNSSGTNAGALDKITEIRDICFRRGALPDDTLSSGTESAMQTALEALTATRQDWPLSLRVPSVSSGGNFELTLTDGTNPWVFDEGITLHLEYRGTDTLTIVNPIGGNFDISKVYTPNSGTVSVVNEVTVKVTVRDIDDNSVIQNARVRMTADAGGPEIAGSVLLEGITNASGQLETTYRYTSDQPVDGRVRKASSPTYYKTAGIVSTITSNGLDLTILMIKDQ